MPFKSAAQLKWMAEQVKLGKITKEKFHEWLDATPSVKALPERVATKPGKFKVRTVKVLK